MTTALSAMRRVLTLRSSIRTAAILVGLYVSAFGVLVAFEDRLIYAPVPATRHWSEPPPGHRAQDVELRTGDGTSVHARWFPRTNATGAVLICHGQAGNVSLECSPRQLAGWQDDLGVSVLIFDYPGYGRSGGSPSETGCYAAADATYAWLTETQQVPPREVLLFGRSLGTGVAVDLASRHSHRALILVSPYTSLPDVAVRRFGLLGAHVVMQNRFPSLAKIGRCTGPTFIVHGTDDNLIPFALGKELYEAANEPKDFFPIEGGRHSDGLPPAFFPSVRDFLAKSGTER